MSHKKGAESLGTILVIIIVLAIIAMAMGFKIPGLPSTAAPAPTGAQQTTVISGCSLSDSVKMTAKNYFTMAASSNDKFELWNLGADTADPNQAAITTATTSSGTATDTASLYSSCDDNTKRDLYWDGGSDYYDERIPSWYLEYNYQTADSVMHFRNVQMGTGGIVTDSLYWGAKPIGTISDFDTAQKCDGVACVGASYNTTVEITDSGTDTFIYNTTTGDGSFTIDFDIGNTVSNTFLKDVVYCFQDTDATSNALEGNEVTSITVQRYTGDDVSNGMFAGGILSVWKEAAGTGSYVCRPFATEIAGAKSGTYRFTFTVSDANWAANEGFKFCIDDVGGYGKFQYPSGNVKATASCWSLKSIGA